MSDLEARIAEVLAVHWSVSTHTDQEPFVDKCDGCGTVILTWGGKGDSYSTDPRTLLADHQAAILAPVIAEAEHVAVTKYAEREKPTFKVEFTNQPIFDQALQDAKAEAWEEGHLAGWEEHENPGPFVNDYWDSKLPNPYRRSNDE